MTTPQFGTLFHFTHLDHVSSILDLGALISDDEAQRDGLVTTEAGNPDIKERRRRIGVPCGPGGTVSEYVPFYFAARSPMMLSIKSGRVPTFRGDHRDLVYFVTSVQQVLDDELPFVITDRNAAVGVAEFSDQVEVLNGDDFVDWNVMNLTIWKDVPEYPDRMERRMAELLVHGEVPLPTILECAAHNDVTAARLEHMFDSAGWAISVTVRPNWYY